MPAVPISVLPSALASSVPQSPPTSACDTFQSPNASPLFPYTKCVIEPSSYNLLLITWKFLLCSALLLCFQSFVHSLFPCSCYSPFSCWANSVSSFLSLFWTTPVTLDVVSLPIVYNKTFPYHGTTLTSVYTLTAINLIWLIY